MADVFVSYARTDKLRVAPLVAAIEAKGWTVWWDPDIAAGQEFDRQISAELKAAAAVVVVWTPQSVESRWVRGEARDAADRGLLVPVRFAGAELPIDVRAIHTTDLDGWDDDPNSPQVQELLRALGAMISRRGTGKATAASPAPAAAAPVTVATAPTGSASPGVTAGISICVLPFANMSGDPEQEYFSDGITEDVITDLTKVSTLSVVSRNTAFTFKGKSVGLSQVARQLNVSHVLEGSVRKAGGRVRITAQLIEGSRDSQVWAERYDRDLNDIFALQDEISQAIVKALKLKLLPEEKKAIEQRGTDNVEAYNLYLMARQYYITGNVGDVRRDEAIIRMCGRATEIDPGYARAWALMALGQMALRFDHGGRGDGGLAAAERALALDSKLAEAHAVKASYFGENGQHEQASAEIDVALSLDPESHDVNTSAAFVCFRQHRLDEAIRYWEKAMALVESDVHSPCMLITCYTAVGNRPAALRVAQVTVTRAEKALAQDAKNGSAMGFGVSGLTTLGQVERAKEWINRALMIDPDNINMRYNFACALSAFAHEADASLELLGPTFQKMPIGFLNHAKVDPDLDALRDHPRFQAMIAAAEARLAAAGDASA
jgi:adenylate cyclase